MRVGIEIAAAVEHLHGLSPPVIHVDLAARNVLVDVEGGRTWLVDFALARELVHAPSKLGVTSSHESLPFRILAPEARVEASNGGLSRASDVFAFGMLLFELFTGAMPWGQRTAPATAWKLTCGNLRPPLPPSPLLDPALSGLIQQCWRQDPASRPGMHEVRRALQTWLDREGTSLIAREPLGTTRAAAASAFVGEAAAATIVRESQPGGLLAGASTSAGSVRRTRGGGGAGSTEYTTGRAADEGDVESTSAAGWGPTMEEQPSEYVRDAS